MSVVVKTSLLSAFLKLIKQVYVSKIFTVFFLFPFSLNLSSQEIDIAKGKSLFNANCASCHKLNRNLVGPALKGVSAKYEKELLYSWIKNSAALIKSGDDQAVAIYEEYNKVAMNAFPQLSNEDIDNILAYTDYVPEPVVAANAGTESTSSSDESSLTNDIVLVLLTVVLLVLITMLFLVTKTLRNIAEKNGIEFEIIPYSQFYLNSLGVSLLENENLQRFKNEIDEYNRIIADESLLKSEFEKLVNEREQWYLNYLLPFNSKLLISLNTRKLLPNFLTNSKKVLYKNLIRCESHRDILLAVLNIYEFVFVFKLLSFA